MGRHEEHFILDGVEVKYCHTCRRALPTTLIYFGYHKSKWDELNPNCRECLGGHFVRDIKEGYKVCHKCGRELEMTSNFYRNKKRKEGYDSPCKDCVREYQRGNRDRINERARIARAENPEKFRERDRKRHRENPEKLAAKNKRARETEKGRTIRRILGQKREAIKKELPASLTFEQWQTCMDYFDNACAYCGKKKKLTQEHFIPLSKGGEYTVNNIIPACISCNSKKNNKDFFEWYNQGLDFYSEIRKKKILKYLNSNGEIQQMALEF